MLRKMNCAGEKTFGGFAKEAVFTKLDMFWTRSRLVEGSSSAAQMEVHGNSCSEDVKIKGWLNCHIWGEVGSVIHRISTKNCKNGMTEKKEKFRKKGTTG